MILYHLKNNMQTKTLTESKNFLNNQNYILGKTEKLYLYKLLFRFNLDNNLIALNIFMFLFILWLWSIWFIAFDESWILFFLIVWIIIMIYLFFNIYKLFSIISLKRKKYIYKVNYKPSKLIENNWIINELKGVLVIKDK